MPPLKTGTCGTCNEKGVKLRPNPFSAKEQCESCREESIIGITDIKKKYSLKDGDLKGLKMVTEAKPAFLGGPDRRWYLVDEIEERVVIVQKEREKEEEAKGLAREARDAEKLRKAVEKEEEKARKKAEKESKIVTKKSAIATNKPVKGEMNDTKRKRIVEENEDDAVAEQKPKRGRGRPAKPTSATELSKADSRPKRGRGRPPKVKVTE